MAMRRFLFWVSPQRGKRRDARCDFPSWGGMETIRRESGVLKASTRAASIMSRAGVCFVVGSSAIASSPGVAHLGFDGSNRAAACAAHSVMFFYRLEIWFEIVSCFYLGVGVWLAHDRFRFWCAFEVDGEFKRQFHSHTPGLAANGPQP